MRFGFLFLGLMFPLFVYSQSAFDSGKSAFDNGDYERATRHFDEVKDSPEAQFYLGRIAFLNNDFSKAISWIEKAKKTEPDSSKYYLWLGHGYGRKAQNSSKLRQPFLAKKSLSNYEKSVEIDPANIEARNSLIEFYLQAPGFMGGGTDKAYKQVEAIAEIDPFQGVLAEGRVLDHDKGPDAAKTVYEQALESGMDSVQIANRLYAILYNGGQFEEAVSVMDQQLGKRDTLAGLHLQKGNALARMSEYDSAYESYQRVQRIDTSLIVVHYQIGRLAGESGQFLDEGEKAITKFIDEGERYGSGTMAWAYYRLGSIQEHQNKPEEAKQSYKLALKSDKKHKESKEALKRLK
ncbi:MAG: tetratricopeptide repeat protein [Bacteroidota bacterium]